VARHPTIDFHSTNIASVGKDSYEVAGDLTIRDVTQNVMLQADSVMPGIKDPSGWWRRGATAKALIDRRDFGLTWNAALESGGFLVGDDVEITIDVEIVRKVIVITPVGRNSKWNL
jgi:polyisoprenoid-binding protein YceI